MTCQGEGGNLCAVFSMHFFAETQYTKQFAAAKRENDKERENFKQNAFAMTTPLVVTIFKSLSLQGRHWEIAPLV